IERGFTANAPVVTAAALIMVAVFAGFVTSGWFMLQPIAVALAVGVLVDAFVVRMTFVPAVLALLGRHAWWLPGWLSRLLPTVDVEGEGLAGVLEHRRWTEQHGRHALRLEDAVAPLLGAPGTLGPLTGSITPGTLLVVRAPDDAARATFLALAAGRLRPASGVVAVHDRLAPDDLAAIQSRAQWIGAGERVAERLAAIGGRGLDRTVVVIEHIGDLAHAAATDDMLIERLDALLEPGATLIVRSRTPHPIHAAPHLHRHPRHAHRAPRRPARGRCHADRRLPQAASDRRRTPPAQRAARPRPPARPVRPALHRVDPRRSLRMKSLSHPRTLIAVLVLPLLVVGLGMWALSGRVDRLDTVPAAVVNLDEGAEIENADGETQTVPFGRLLAGALTQPGTVEGEQTPSTTGFDWQLTSEDDAEQGLADGTYSAVVVIPEDFSEHLATIGTPEASQAILEVTTNDASGQINALVGTAVAEASASTVGGQMA